MAVLLWIVLILVCLFFLAVLSFLKPAKPVGHDLLLPVLEYLLQHGEDNSWIDWSHGVTGKTISFRKSVTVGVTGIWSREVRGLNDEETIRLKELSKTLRSQRPVTANRNLRVPGRIWFGRDVQDAAEFARAVFGDICGLDIRVGFHVSSRRFPSFFQILRKLRQK